MPEARCRVPRPQHPRSGGDEPCSGRGLGFPESGTSQRRKAGSCEFILGHAKHAVGTLTMLCEPRYERLRGVRSVEKVIVLDRDPSTSQGTQSISQPIVRRDGCCVGRLNGGMRRARPDPNTASAGGESEPHERAPGLVRGEIGPVKPGHCADDLLWREAALSYHHEVRSDRLWVDPTEGPHYVARAQYECPTGDLDVLRDRFLCHGFSALSLTGYQAPPCLALA